ncbi:MAG: hypothetical protein WCY09_09950 [Candidatus Omnitrophota bacterium]
MGGGLWPSSSSEDKFSSLMSSYRALATGGSTVSASAPSGESSMPVYLAAMESTGFKLDVLSIVVAEIIFAVLVILLKYILNKMGDR